MAHRLGTLRRLWPALLVPALFLAGGCLATGEIEVPPDELFGHRFEGRAADGRETVLLEADDDAEGFSVHSAVYDTVHVRPAAFGPGEVDVPVEVLVKGAFPDGCTRLHRVDQTRAGNIIDVTLEMKRPQGALCATVLRPYRFYFTLESRYAAGPYTLKINGRAHPFEIRSILRSTDGD